MKINRLSLQPREATESSRAAGSFQAAIAVGELLDTIEYDYPNFHLSMDCFWCEIIHGELILKEAEDAKWLTNEHLTDVKWLPADVTLIEKIGEELHETKDSK